MESEARWSWTPRLWDNLDKMVERNPGVKIPPAPRQIAWERTDKV